MKPDEIQAVGFFDLKNPAPRLYIRGRVAGERPDRTFQRPTHKYRTVVHRKLRPVRRKFSHAETRRALVIAKFNRQLAQVR